jgi:glycosyltransferase involved in cell wall biosynthesis
MKGLRILQISTTDLGGGAEESAWNLFQAYRQRAFDSWLAVGRKLSDDRDVLVIPNEANRPRWTRLWRRIQAGGASRGLGRLPQLLGKLAWLGEPKRFIEPHLGIEDFNYPGAWRLLDLPPRRPSVVHCHNLHANYFDLRVLPWLSKRVPVILNLRDAWLLSGHCAHSLGCERWKTGCGKCPDLTIYPAVRRDSTGYNWRRKQRIYARSRLYVTAPSQWLIDKAKRSILRALQYRVIPNAIDLTIFRPMARARARQSLGLLENAKIVLFTTHNTFKDSATVETALSHLEVREDGAELLFIGLGRSGRERRLGRGWMRYVEFERDRHRMAEYYNAADVFVHAAKAEAEAFGKTVAESMACGTPVVATAVGGIPEQITDGVTGFLVPARDASGIARGVQSLLLDYSLWRRISQVGRESAMNRFGLDRQASDFLTWYKEILDEREQRHPHALSNPD